MSNGQNTIFCEDAARIFVIFEKTIECPEGHQEKDPKWPQNLKPVQYQGLLRDGGIQNLEAKPFQSYTNLKKSAHEKDLVKSHPNLEELQHSQQKFVQNRNIYPSYYPFILICVKKFCPICFIRILFLFFLHDFFSSFWGCPDLKRLLC